MAMERLFALCLLVASVSVSALALEYTPVYVWSNTGLLGDSSTAQVQYQTTSPFEIIKNAISGELTSSKVDENTIVAVLINKASTSNVNVEGLVTQAKSSVVFPNAQLTLSTDKLATELASHLEDSKAVHTVLGCGQDTSAVGSVYLASSDVRVLVICNSETGIKDVQELQDSLEDSKRSYIVAYVSEPQLEAAEELVAATRRSLLSSGGFGPYTECGPACQTQVRWLEGILAALLLVLASFSGLSCLYFLGTPTKFDAPKDNTQ